jgi:hypothetical protein
MRGVTSDPFNASFARLRLAWWPVVQAALASGLAWYITHDALGHPQPFFAPIAAAISLSAFVGRRVMRDGGRGRRLEARHARAQRRAL